MRLEARDLHVTYGEVEAVAGVSLGLDSGQALAVVGESGSGKSTLVRALLGLPEPARITAGEVRFEGRSLGAMIPRERRELLGRRLGFVPQDTGSSLDPVIRVGAAIAEAVRVRCGTSRAEARRRAIDAMEAAGIPDAASRARCYPHELSGGLRQRVLLAAAMALRPSLLLADEPTSSLDAALQGGILRLLHRLLGEGLGVLLVTHQLPLAAHLGGRVAVVYAGRIVEEGPAREVFAAPRHPYTRDLVRALPERGRAGERFAVGEGFAIGGGTGREGCPYLPRCFAAEPSCGDLRPSLEACGAGRRVACARWEAVAGREDAAEGREDSWGNRGGAGGGRG